MNGKATLLKNMPCVVLAPAPGIGDFLVRVWSIQLLAENFLEVHVVLGLPESLRDFVESFFTRHKNIHFYYFAKKYRKTVLSPYTAFFADCFQISKTFRKIKPGVVFCLSDGNSLPGVIKLTIMSFAAGFGAKKFSVKPHRFGFLGHHMVSLREDTFKRAKYLEFTQKSLAYLNPEYIQHDFSLIEEKTSTSQGEGRTIVMAPGSKVPTHRWPFYRELIEKIREKKPAVTICLVGTQDEAALIDSLTAPGVKTLVGKNMMAVSQAIGSSDLVLANDSGIMHVGVALGVPTVALFGAGPLEPWGGYEEGFFHPIFHQQPCSPCRLWTCSHHSCMRAITVDEVYQKIMEVLFAEYRIKTVRKSK